VSSNDFDRKQHWETVYSNKAAEETSWYQPVPRLSLSMIANTGFGRDAALVDIGGGASRLVDHLLDQGYRDLTVLDISSAALANAARRLGDKAGLVTWIEADVTTFSPPRQFDLWHDRAAFHFLTEAGDRQKYLEVLQKALVPGGQAILATFAPGGPAKCSGLDIVQYDAKRLGGELGPEFVLMEQQEERHVTPSGGEQLFNFFRFKRRSL
jgi:trans-aconitate methyltransferase